MWCEVPAAASSLNVRDPAGAYVDRFVPELAGLPAKYKYAPWTAPKEVLRKAGVALGDTYPRPLVDHKAASAANIARFKAAQAALKGAKPAAKPAAKKAPARKPAAKKTTAKKA